MRRSSMLFAIPAAALLLAGSVSAFAQDDNPENNRTLSPDLCQVEPRSADELIALFGLDAASVDEAPVVEPAPIAIPLGQPAGPEVANAITQTVEQFFACTNAGDTARVTAMLSDIGVFRFYGFGPREPEVDETLRNQAAGATTPREDGTYIRLIAVTDVSILPDGRVAAFIVNNEPLLPPRGPETLLMVFSEGENGWVIDDYYDFTIIAPEPEGTPEADGTPASE